MVWTNKRKTNKEKTHLMHEKLFQDVKGGLTPLPSLRLFFYIYFFMVLIVKESGIPVSTGEAIMGTMVMKTVAMM